MEYKEEFCRCCGLGSPWGKLSNRGYCPVCVMKKRREAISQMEAKAGPIYEKWRAHYIAAMSGVLVRLEKEREQND